MKFCSINLSKCTPALCLVIVSMYTSDSQDVLEEVNKDVSQPELLFAAGTIVVQKESGKVPAIVELNRADDHSWVL